VTQDAKERILEWLFSQGTSTVLLCCILGFMAYDKITLEPQRAKSQQDANQELALRHVDAIKQVIASHERERDVFLAMLQIKKQATP
jgi:hypothetical protein